MQQSKIQISEYPKLFGMVLPGEPVNTDFIPTDHTYSKFSLSIPFPLSKITRINEIVIFLLPSIDFPSLSGALVYWSANATNIETNCNIDVGFELLGALTSDKPSGIFSTNWSTNEKFQNLLKKSLNVMTITIGISIEPLTNITNLKVEKSGVDNRTNIAKKIALDLFHYLKSFDDKNNEIKNGQMMVSMNIFEQWYRRFEVKLKRNVNFFMNCTEEC